MTKIQCVKDFECEVCHIKGMLQILGNYGRVRHYVGLDSVSKKPKFEYHKQRIEYVRQIQNIDLNSQNIIDPNGQGIDLEINGNTFKSENKSFSDSCSGSIVRSSIAASRHHKMGESRGPGSKSRPEHH